VCQVLSRFRSPPDVSPEADAMTPWCVSHGIMAVSADTGVPVTFGVLTTLTEEQAIARAADGPDNKGREAAWAAVEMSSLVHVIGDGARHDG
jgi:6,7-dimethyl-8-ribityllumazine synthase